MVFELQDPISQFFVRNPAELLHKEPEAAVLDSNNELVHQVVDDSRRGRRPTCVRRYLRARKSTTAVCVF